jgi:hypothetical protein
MLVYEHGGTQDVFAGGRVDADVRVGLTDVGEENNCGFLDRRIAVQATLRKMGSQPFRGPGNGAGRTVEEDRDGNEHAVRKPGQFDGRSDALCPTTGLTPRADPAAGEVRGNLVDCGSVGPCDQDLPTGHLATGADGDLGGRNRIRDKVSATTLFAWDGVIHGHYSAGRVRPRRHRSVMAGPLS